MKCMWTNSKLLLPLFACVLSLSLYAQTDDLTTAEREALTRQAKIKVETFTSYVSFVASKQYDDATRQDYAQAALNLFLGKGKEWTDRYGNPQPAPSMQLSSLRNGVTKTHTYPVAMYMYNLQYLNYTEVTVTNSKAQYIEEIKKVDDDTYEASLTYLQIFVGKRDNIVVYGDKTQKSIKVIFKRIGDMENKRWDIKLGDIVVSATEKLD